MWRVVCTKVVCERRCIPHARIPAMNSFSNQRSMPASLPESIKQNCTMSLTPWLRWLVSKCRRSRKHAQTCQHPLEKAAIKYGQVSHSTMTHAQGLSLHDSGDCFTQKGLDNCLASLMRMCRSGRPHSTSNQYLRIDVLTFFSGSIFPHWAKATSLEIYTIKHEDTINLCNFCSGDFYQSLAAFESWKCSHCRAAHEPRNNQCSMSSL